MVMVGSANVEHQGVCVVCVVCVKKGLNSQNNVDLILETNYSLIIQLYTITLIIIVNYQDPNPG